MARQTKGGEWWDKSWTPVVGCDMSLPCAKRCWARPFANRLKGNPSPKVAAKYAGITDAAGQLERPLFWRKPYVVAVSLMGDWMHENLPDEARDRILAVEALCPQHTFIHLTKRWERQQKYFTDLAKSIIPLERAARSMGRTFKFWGGDGKEYSLLPWPIPNIIIGASAWDQPSADEARKWLLQTPAARRLLHLEPMLGPVDLGFTRLVSPQERAENNWLTEIDYPGPWRTERQWRIHGLVVGGETGPDARPMHPNWARRVRDQCVAAGVPYFHKQNGEYIWEAKRDWNYRLDKFYIEAGPGLDDGWFRRVPRKIAGRLLDGREWNECPGMGR